MSEATKRHNELAASLVKQIIKSSDGDLVEDFIVLESIVAGVIVFHEQYSSMRGQVETRSALLDKLYDSLVARMKDLHL